MFLLSICLPQPDFLTGSALAVPGVLYRPSPFDDVAGLAVLDHWKHALCYKLRPAGVKMSCQRNHELQQWLNKDSSSKV